MSSETVVPVSVCSECGNTHRQDIPKVIIQCLFKLVQESCWEFEVLSDTSELIATRVLDKIEPKTIVLDDDDQ